MDDFLIIENTKESMDEFGYCYGAEFYEITNEEIQALLSGKVLASTVNEGEYSIFIKLKGETVNGSIKKG